MGIHGRPTAGLRPQARGTDLFAQGAHRLPRRHTVKPVGQQALGYRVGTSDRSTRRRLWLVLIIVVAVIVIGWVLVINLLPGLALAGAALLVALLVFLRHRARTLRETPETTAVDVPTKPHMIINPRSGGGVAQKVGLAQASKAAGITTVTLEPDDDLQALAHRAADEGCDLLMVAGGDGSLAIVAGVALDRDIAFACVPAGTRNHFAMDIGLDRDDPLAALDAATDGVAISVTVGQVGERVFLNNVSFGTYADAISDPDYRDHRAESMATAVEGRLGKPEDQPGLEVQSQGEQTRRGVGTLLISNNPYTLTGPPDFGARASMDTGLLGVMASRPPGQDQGKHRRLSVETWTSSAATVSSSQATLPAGVDGELIHFDTPVTLECTQRIRVLVPRKAASPPQPRPSVHASLTALEQLAGRWRGSSPKQEDQT